MIDRAEVESLLACMEQIHKPNNGVIAELCRVYLAWLDAPAVDVKECCGHAIIGSDWDDDLTGYSHVGKRVRLVTDAEAK